MKIICKNCGYEKEFENFEELECPICFSQLMSEEKKITFEEFYREYKEEEFDETEICLENNCEGCPNLESCDADKEFFENETVKEDNFFNQIVKDSLKQSIEMLGKKRVWFDLEGIENAVMRTKYRQLYFEIINKTK